MTANESFDRLLAGWLVDEAQGRVADHLAEVLVATRATRQRRGWASLERWLPMTSIASTRPFLPRPALPLLVVVALLAAALAAAVLLQVGRSTIPPLGAAANGRIVYLDGTSVLSAAADGTDPKTMASLSDPVFEPAISPDGARVAYAVEHKRIEILPIAEAGGQAPITVTAPGMSEYGAPTWSPTGDQIAFLGGDTGGDHVFIANADGTGVHEVTGADVDAGDVVGWPGFSPDGQWLAFLEAKPDTFGRVKIVHPDGTGLRVLETRSVEVGNGASLAWSPDPASPRLLYLSAGQGVAYFDLAIGGEIDVATGFWATWSPTGDRISYWSDGTKVVDTPTSDYGDGTPLAVFPSMTGNCQDHPENAGKAFCGPATWSPDGTRLIATEITGKGLLSLRSDGKGDPIFLDLGTDLDPGEGGVVAWQPVLQAR